MNWLKSSTFRSPKWLRTVAAFPCVECGSTETQAAHRNEGKGMGIKTDDCLTASLCPRCHAEIDQGKGMSRDERRAKIDGAILKTITELARAGRLEIK